MMSLMKPLLSTPCSSRRCWRCETFEALSLLGASSNQLNRQRSAVVNSSPRARAPPSIELLRRRRCRSAACSPSHRPRRPSLPPCSPRPPPDAKLDDSASARPPSSVQRARPACSSVSLVGGASSSPLGRRRSSVEEVRHSLPPPPPRVLDLSPTTDQLTALLPRLLVLSVVSPLRDGAAELKPTPSTTTTMPTSSPVDQAQEKLPPSTTTTTTTTSAPESAPATAPVVAATPAVAASSSPSSSPSESSAPAGQSNASASSSSTPEAADATALATAAAPVVAATPSSTSEASPTALADSSNASPSSLSAPEAAVAPPAAASSGEATSTASAAESEPASSSQPDSKVLPDVDSTPLTVGPSQSSDQAPSQPPSETASVPSDRAGTSSLSARRRDVPPARSPAAASDAAASPSAAAAGGPVVSPTTKALETSANPPPPPPKETPAAPSPRTSGFEQPPPDRTVLFKGFDPYVTRTRIRTLIEQKYGPVADYWSPKLRKNNGKRRVYIIFASADGARSAIDEGETVLGNDGLNISMERVNDVQQLQQAHAGTRAALRPLTSAFLRPPPDRTVIFKNFGQHATKTLIRKVIEQKYGLVSEFWSPNKKWSYGRNVYVIFASADSARSAIHEGRTDIGPNDVSIERADVQKVQHAYAGSLPTAINDKTRLPTDRSSVHALGLGGPPSSWSIHEPGLEGPPSSGGSGLSRFRMASPPPPSSSSQLNVPPAGLMLASTAPSSLPVGSNSPGSDRTIKIKGFGAKMTKDRLKEAFEVLYGSVREVQIHHRDDPGRRAYISFDAPSAAQTAVAEQMTNIDGQKVQITRSQGLPNRPVPRHDSPLRAFGLAPTPFRQASPPPSPWPTYASVVPSWAQEGSTAGIAQPLAPVTRPQPARAPHFLRSDAPKENLQQFRPTAYPPVSSILTNESFRRSIAVFQPLYASGRWSEKTFLEQGVERTYLAREILREEFVEGIFEPEHFERLGDWSPTIMGSLFPRWASAIQDLHNVCRQTLPLHRLRRTPADGRPAPRFLSLCRQHHAEIRSNRDLIRIRIISHKTFYPPTPVGSLPDPLRPPEAPQGLTTRDLHLAASLEKLVQTIKEMLGQEATGL